VSIIDSGHGVDRTIGPRIFDALFTTKSTGTGMGPAICRSLVSAHGGRLWMSDDHSPGAAFHFSLPGARQRMPDVRAPPQEVAGSSR
jgi:signal transduction histidine kinase